MATLSEVTQALVDLLRDNWVTLELETEEDVYYGDQPKLAHHPSITVEGTVVERPLTNTGMVVTKEFNVFIMIYHSALNNISVKRKEVDEYYEGVVDLIHTDKKLGGLVVHGHVIRDEVGAADRGGTLMRTIRLTYQAINRESIWT